MPLPGPLHCLCCIHLGVSNPTLHTTGTCSDTALHEHTEFRMLETEMLPANPHRRVTRGFPDIHAYAAQQQPQPRALTLTPIFGFSASTTSQIASNCCVGWGRVCFQGDHQSSETYPESISCLQRSPQRAIRQQSRSITASLPVNA